MLVATAAGFTTTSSLLSWLIYGLVTYPGTQDRLLQELIDAGMSPDTNTTFTADNTSAAALPYLDAYVKETQRLHNPSFQPGRTAKTDLVLPGGYRLPRDAVVIPALHHIHTNPSLWDNPARFDPDRWLRRDAATGKPLPPFSQKGSYIPFAAGPRGCIGFNFALQEVKVFLPMLVLRYEFLREPGEPVEYDPMFQLVRPVNFYVRARRRESWPPKSGEGGKRDSGVVTAVAV